MAGKNAGENRRGGKAEGAQALGGFWAEAERNRAANEHLYREHGVETGWFGIPGGPESRNTMVHVCSGRKPVCGAKVGERMQFQFCSAGIHEDYVECERCLKAIPGVEEAAKAALDAKEETARLLKRARLQTTAGSMAGMSAFTARGTA